MTNNQEEFTNDTTFENLECWKNLTNLPKLHVSLKKKVTKELDVINLAFSNILAYYIRVFSCYSRFSEQYSCIESFAYMC